MTELLGQLGIVQVAAFHKGCEGIVVEDGSPGVAVVAGIVASGEDMLEIGALVAADNLRYQTDAVEVVGLKSIGIHMLFLGDAVVSHIKQRGGQQLGVDEALSIGLRSGNLGYQLVGNALAGLVMLGIGLHHLRVAAPVLHNLGRQLDKVARDIGTGKRRIMALAQQSVQGVAELVEQRLALVEIEERGFVTSGFGKIAHHLDNGDYILTLAVHLLATELGHPGTAALAGAGEEIHIENADNLIAVHNLIGVSLLVVGGQVGILAEGDTIQLVGCGKGTLSNVVEREIGAHNIVVQVIFLLAEFLAVVTPVPRLQFGCGVVLGNQFLVFGALLLGLGQCGTPNLHQAGVHGLGGLGQTVVQHIVGVGLETKDIGTLQTEVDQSVDNLGVVKFAAVATSAVSLPHLLAQAAVGAILHKGFPRGQVEFEDQFAFGCFVGIGGLLGGGNLVGSNAGGSSVKHQLIVVGSLQHILGKTQGERGNLLIQFTETSLFLGGNIGAAAHKALVGLFEQTHLFGIKTQTLTLVIDGLDTLKEFCVQGDVVAMSRELGSNLFGNSLHLVAVFALAQIEEHTGHVVEQLAAVLISLYGVLESGSIRVVHNGIDFCHLLFHALLEGRHVMFGLDFPKIGNLIGSTPLCKERIVHTFFTSCCEQGHCCEPCN